MQYVISLDPGLLGAMCLYNLSNNKVEEVLNIPIYKKDKKSYLDGKRILEVFRRWSQLTNKVIIELQTVMHGDGGKSTITTLTNFGYLLGLLDSLEFIVEKVAPTTWQSVVLKDVIDPGEPVKLKPTKRKSLAFAKNINPKNDGISDAYCIACYYKTIYN